MADEVKLITFAGETVSPLYDGLMQELYTGGGGIITGAVVTIKDASNLHITGGYGALCGREFEIFASDIPVTLSSSGTLKGRLYLHMDLAQSGAPIELLVEVASSLTPVVQDSDVNTTNGVYEVNLATFDVGTSAISNLVDVSPKLSKIPDQISLLNSAKTISASSVDLLGYSSATNLFTVPSDGYLVESYSTVDSSVSINFQIGNTSDFITDTYMFDNRYMSHIFFVKKGMRLFVQDNSANCTIMYRALVDR